MTPKAVSRRLLVAQICIGTLLGATLAAPAAAVPNPETDGVQNLAACYSQNKAMAVELVIDESQSLRATDPEGRRVELAEAIVQAMGQISTVALGGESGRIDLQVVGFGTQTSPVVSWRTLDRSTADEVVAEIASFRERDDQLDTDYVDALTIARQDVLRRSAVMRPDRPREVCGAVFWFSDGKFDFEPHGIQPGWAPDLKLSSEVRVREAVQRGTQLLCQPDGIADQYRSSEIYLLTAALLSSGFDQSDEALLRSVTEGGDGCGALPGRPTGTYFSAADIDRLVRAIVPAVIGPPPPEPDSCTAPCERTFEVDGATTAVNLFVDARPGGPLELRSPSGEVFDLQPVSADADLAGASVTSRAAGTTRLITIDLTNAPRDAVGTWTVSFAPEGEGDLTIWVSRRTGITLSPVPPEPWTRGESGSATFRLIGSSGQPLDPADIDSIEVVGRIAHGEEPVEVPLTLTPGSSEVILTATPSRSEPASTALIDVSGTVTTAAGDLVPVSASSEVSVTVAGAPMPQTLELGVIEVERQRERDDQGRQPVLPVNLRRTLTVVGAPDSDGTFCLSGESTLTVGGQPVMISALAAECTEVAAGSTVEVPIEVTIAEPVDGSISGVVSASTRSNIVAEAADISVPVLAQVVIPPGDSILHQGTFWALVAASVLIAGALWVGLSWWTSRFKDPTLIRGFRVPVKIRAATSEFSMPPMSRDQWTYLVETGPRSVIFEELEISAPVRVLRAQDAVVARTGHICHGVRGSAGGHSSLKGRIAHQLQGQWVFAVKAGVAAAGPDSELTGDLYFFVLDDAITMEADSGGVIERAKRELSARLPEILERVRRHASDPEPPDQGTPTDRAESGHGSGLM